MATLDSLLVQIDASTELLRRELQKGGVAVDNFSRNTERRLGGMSGMFQKFGGHLRSALTAFGVGFGATAIVNFTKGAIQAADAIGETARAAGVGAERFQRLSFAFQNNGVEAAQFDSAMKTLNTRLGQFITTGGGPAKAALERLGLAQKVLNGEIRTSEQLFDGIVSAFESVGSSAERAALASAFFGRNAGPLMVDTLSKGTDALNEAAAAASGVFSDEQIRNADALNDSMKRLASTIGVGLKGAVIDFAAVWAKAFGVDEFENAVQPLEHRLKELELRERGIRSGFLGSPEARDAQLADVARQRQELLDADRYERLINTPFIQPDAPDDGLSFMSGTPAKLPSEFRSGNFLGGFAEAIKNSELQEISAVVAKLPDEVKKLSPEFNAAVKSLVNYNDELSETAKRQQELWQMLGSGLQSSLANAFRGISTNFSDLLKDMAAEFLASSIVKGMGSFFGSLAGGGSGVGKFFAGLFGGARALGGPVERGKGYLINEGKPELFWPGVSGSMVPVAAGGGGGDNHYHLTQTFSGPPPPDAAKLGAELLARARADAKNERRRGR